MTTERIPPPSPPPHSLLPVLLDHGLYRDLDRSFRLDFCRLWRALILCDEAQVERVGLALGAGHYSRFLPVLFTSRSFTR